MTCIADALQQGKLEIDATMMLEQLHRDHSGKVSDKWSSYLRVYEAVLAPYRDAPIRLLEIGVQNGGSLEVWAKMFPNAQTIVGCDIDTRCATLSFDDPRIHLVVADANSQEGYTAIQQISRSFDIVIDDGSHQSADIIASFARYFPLVADGGLYIAEDLHCSYWPEFGGDLGRGKTAIEMFKRLVDVVNVDHWRHRVSASEFLRPILSDVPSSSGLSKDDLHAIACVRFYDSLCILEKSQSARGLGERVVRGRQAVVSDEVISQQEALGSYHRPSSILIRIRSRWQNFRDVSPKSKDNSNFEFQRSKLFVSPRLGR